MRIKIMPVEKLAKEHESYVTYWLTIGQRNGRRPHRFRGSS